MATIRFRITGDTQLLMHNGQMSDPENSFAQALKEVTSKRQKTQEDYEEIKRIEFEGGLYYDPKLGPFIPAQNLEAAIVEAGRLRKKGTNMERSIKVVEQKVKLEYAGPRDPKKMYPDFAFTCGVSAQGSRGGGRTQRTRPMFPIGWSATFTATFKEHVVSRDDVITSLKVAGDLTGLLDGRPKYGKFSVEVLPDE